MSELLIQADAEAFDPVQAVSMPEYIMEQFDSRYGRAGRGRLWVSDLPVFDQIRKDGIVWDDAAKRVDYMRQSGGIVFLREDYAHVKVMPGLVTDIHMKVFNPDV